MRLRRLRLSVTGGIFILVMISLYAFGLLDHYREVSYEREFEYPLNVDIRPLVQQYRAGISPDILPINYYNYKYFNTLENKCFSDNIRLVIIVKSALENFDRRLAIRSTWGLEKRFPKTKISTVFFVGIKVNMRMDLQNKISMEKSVHGDVIQTDAVDNYYNNTLKTMLAFRWAYEHCNNADYYLFSDDDMYISTRNALRFLDDIDNGRNETKSIILYSGFVFNSSPHRHITSRWYIDLDEYPFDRWPSYVTAGAYILSGEAVKTIYAGSLFVKHFRFDDIYLGIVSKKVGITPTHNENFYFYKKKYDLESYKNVIASHGYGISGELLKVWNEELLAGHA